MTEFHALPPRARTLIRLRSGVLTIQVALSVVLLVAAGLLVRSFGELRRVELGFSPSQVLTMRLSLPREKYSRDRIVPALEELEARVQTIAGVRGAAASTQYPPGNVFSAPVSHPGEASRESEGRMADITNATPSYFATLGYRLQQGRLFSAADNERAPRVALLNETAAKRFFTGRSPIGERLFLGDSASGVEVQVVGITADVKNRGLDAPVAAEVFIPARQQQVAWNNQFFLLVRTAGDPMRALPGIREQLKAMDPDQPVYSISTVEQELGDALLKRRAAMAFLLSFAIISLVLACVGIYGLVTYAVNERVREIGIRMALGAVAGDVRRLVLRQVLIIVGVGALAGLLLSVAAAGSMRALVFGVSPTDPVTLVVVAILLPSVAIAAAALPTRRATRIDPVEALREG